MAASTKKNKLIGARSVFLAGEVKRMRDLADLYPTQIAKSLGMNHSRYIEKLRKPETFTFSQIWKLSRLLDIDVQLIIDVIKAELARQTGKRPS